MINLFVRNNNKKSQVELFGLAVFVMLIIIGLLVFVSLQKKNVESRENFGITKYLDNKLATEILNLMFTTTVSDTDIKVQQLLRSYVRDKLVFEIPNVRSELDDIMESIINETLKENGYDYYFFASSRSADELCTTSYKDNCSSEYLPTNYFGDYNYYEYGDNKICFCGYDYEGRPGFDTIQLDSVSRAMGNIYIYLMIQSTKITED